MDEELKGYLDALRQDLTGQIAAASTHAEMLNAETRTHAERLNAETRAHVERLNAETWAHAEDLHTWGRILIENVHRDVRAVAEGVQVVSDKLDRIAEDHESRIRRLEERMP